MINPLHHAESPARTALYKVEPYVMAADVYAVAPHTGRGGWTWYTGSAGWMYRLVVESLLGLRLTAGRLQIAPRLPEDWPGYKLRYRYGKTVYRISVRRGPDEDMSVLVDGVMQQDHAIALVDDRQEHQVEVNLQKQVSELLAELAG